MNAIEQAVKAMEAASFILGAYTPDRWNQELTAKWRDRAAELDAAIAALSSPCGGRVPKLVGNGVFRMVAGDAYIRLYGAFTGTGVKEGEHITAIILAEPQGGSDEHGN